MNIVEQDAREFGLHVKQGGWRLALLVARNVKRGTGAGERTDLQPRGNRPKVGKVSAREFSEWAQTDHKRVLRYLDAWDKAAKDGIVPPASDLTPGMEVALDVEQFEAKGVYFSNYYSAKATPKSVQAQTSKAMEIIQSLPEEQRREVAAVVAKQMPAAPNSERQEGYPPSVLQRRRSKEQRAQDEHEYNMRILPMRQSMEAPLRVDLLLSELETVRDELNEMTQEGILTEELVLQIQQAVKELADLASLAYSLCGGSNV